MKEVNQPAFLEAYKETGSVRAACELVGINRRTHYVWMEEDETYPERFKDAQRDAAERLEEEARRRAVEGVREPVGWHQGQPGGYVQRYSDTLLIFLMKGAMPEKYRERYEHTGANGAPLRTEIVFVDPTAEGE